MRLKDKAATLAPILILLTAAALVWAWHTLRPPQPQSQAAHCPDLHAGCRVQTPRRPVELRVQGALKTLSPFTLSVRAPGAQRVTAHFDMEGMDMGFNLYTLRPAPDGVFQARVTLPVCVTGRRDWQMHLEVDDEPISIPFVTQM